MKIGVLTLIIALSFSLMAQSNKKQKMEPEKVKIEIWSDVVCPFCIIGKEKMEQAITKLNAEEKVEIIWHSFQLDPDFPMNVSTPSIENLSEKKGYSVEQINQMCAQLTQQGKEYGIDFKFDKALTFNTLDAHRLVKWSETNHKSNELEGDFMKAYFSEGIDLSLDKNLLSIVEKVGLDVEKAKQILESDSYMEEVKQDIYESRQLGIRGVPYFLIDGKKSINGAQSDKVFENVIESALQKIKAEEKTTQEGICLPTGECK